MTSLFSCQCLHAQEAGRKKVGVVLSGGGAKGAAHIGVLKAIEEAGIPIDYIAGTSMGAVIGGLYAAGYTPAQLDTLIKGQDWEFLLSDKTQRKRQSLDKRENEGKYQVSVPLFKIKKPTVSGLVRGQNLTNLLAKLTIGYHDSIDFRQLPTPFACVATNIVNGEEIVFTGGKLTTAIRSSMAIPGMFTPVKMDGMVLVDGGLVNNYPVDVARRMGADIVIGATVQSELPKADQINNLPDVLNQIINVACRKKFDDNVKDSDVHLQIDTRNHSMLDFKPEVIDSMICHGYETASRSRDKLMKVKEEVFAGCSGNETVPKRTTGAASRQTAIPIRNILYKTDNRHEVEMIIRKCKLKENSRVDVSGIEEAVRILQDEFNYPDAYYALSKVGEEYDLTFNVMQKNESKFQLGIRFDTEELISAIAHTEFFFNTQRASSLSLYGKVGKQYMLGTRFSFDPFYHYKLGISYEFRKNDVDVNRKGKRQYNLSFRNHQAEIHFTNVAIRNFLCEGGVRMEAFDYDKLLSSEANTNLPSLERDVYFNYFLNVRYNNQDKNYYPTRGSVLKVGYTLITDDFIQMGGGSPVSAVDASWSGAFSLTERFVLLPSGYGRILFGNDVPPIYSNIIGGDYAGKYVSQQMPFNGINSVEMVDNAFAAGALDLRQRIGKENYVTLSGCIGLSAPRINSSTGHRFLYGTKLKYGYNSKFGPMEATLGYYGDSERPVVYANLGYYF